MINHHTNQLFFDNVEVPVENLVGQEGMGFRYIIDGWNAERILVAAEAIGDGHWFIERAAKYASERIVFGRAIGSNQGIQFPIAQAYAQIEAADLVRYQAATKFDRKEKCGAEANMAKFLASEAAWAAANACLTTHGGYGFAAEYDVERKFRETRLIDSRAGEQQLGARVSWTACLGHAEIVLKKKMKAENGNQDRAGIIFSFHNSSFHFAAPRKLPAEIESSIPAIHKQTPQRCWLHGR